MSLISRRQSFERVAYSCDTALTRLGIIPDPSLFSQDEPLLSTWAPLSKGLSMLELLIILIVVAVVAGALGFTGIARGAAGAAKIIFYILVVIVVIMLLLGVLGVAAIF